MSHLVLAVPLCPVFTYIVKNYINFTKTAHTLPFQCFHSTWKTCKNNLNIEIMGKLWILKFGKSRGKIMELCTHIYFFTITSNLCDKFLIYFHSKVLQNLSLSIWSICECGGVALIILVFQVPLNFSFWTIISSF